MTKWATTDGLSREQLAARIQSLQLTVDGLEQALAEARSTDPKFWHSKVRELAAIVMEATGDEDVPPEFADMERYLRYLEAKCLG